MPTKTLARDEVPISPLNSTSEYSKSIKSEIKENFSQTKEIGISIGGDGSTVIDKSQKSYISKNARLFLNSYENKNQGQQASNILDKIDDLVSGYNDLELPQFNISQAEDNTIGLTWKVANATLGIGIDPNPNDSSWFLLIGEENRGVTAFGSLGKFDIDLLLNWIVYLLNRIQRKEERE